MLPSVRPVCAGVMPLARMGVCEPDPEVMSPGIAPAPVHCIVGGDLKQQQIAKRRVFDGLALKAVIIPAHQVRAVVAMRARSRLMRGGVIGGQLIAARRTEVIFDRYLRRFCG